MTKPYSESCDQNRDPILNVIEPVLRKSGSVFEVGSGTGQHAVYFAARMPRLRWYTSDIAENLPGIRAWVDEAKLDNLVPPVELDVNSAAWPSLTTDAVFTANTCHIMAWREVEALFAGVGRMLGAGGRFLVYGPFNYNGAYTSASNARFDAWLKSRDPASGVRDFEALDRLAELHGMSLAHDYAMPANNRILYWRKH